MEQYYTFNNVAGEGKDVSQFLGDNLQIPSQESTSLAAAEAEDDSVWFQIEKEQDRGTSMSQSVTRMTHNLMEDRLTYQEVMLFSKFVSMFEDKKNKNQMMFWLLLVNPISELQCCSVNKLINNIIRESVPEQ